MGEFLRTAMKSAFSLWLTATLAFAPAAGALADCVPEMPKSHQSMLPDANAPCDAPCTHCEGDEDQQPCKGHCAGLTVSIVPSTIAFAATARAERVAVQRHVSPVAFARPPDTPPPRSFPV
jgi:hypothetical protein